MIKGMIILYLLDGTDYVISAPYTFRSITECRDEIQAIYLPVIEKYKDKGIRQHTYICGTKEEVRNDYTQ